jgi:GNAT superfamily N-acetyltransferase
LSPALYVRTAIDRVRRAEFRSLFRIVANQLYSETAGVVVWKDLTSGPGLAEAKRQPPIRPASETDLQSLIDTDQQPDVDADELWQRRLRRDIASTIGLDGCFVADAPGAGPSFMQYLFTAKDNERLRSRFPGLFPVLGPDEAMVEFLYVAPEARSPGLAVNCLLQVADEARRQGASSVISFIRPTNKGALFVNHLAGYKARSVRRSKRRFFRRTYSFEPWPAGASQSLADVAGGRVAIS